MLDGINASLSALGAFSTRLSVTANNLANMQSENYSSYDTVMEEVPSGGVRARVRREGLADQERQQEDNSQQNMSHFTPRHNNVDVVHDMVSLIETRFAFTANIKAIQMQNELLQVGIHLGNTIDTLG
ncbi:MAG: flagellar basal body rod C-terminal domain-containing protein [Candidatus Auribacterota bacterium]|jgi:flagellar basal-body rod protein FlgC|nr:flagellar basal body rod C-terminal domain-containing protein [Candidatus Auribacterota bacterium]